MKRFNIVIAKEDGGVEVYPMKEWLRQHPDENSSGRDPTSSTSHQLRDALRRSGWLVRETETEVQLFRPGGHDETTLIDQVLGSAERDSQEALESADPAVASFSLEYQLRDFIAQNLNAIDVGGRRLRLYVDPTGRDGIEYPSGVGPIDVLAVDDEGSFYVFELKRARSPDHAIGQLARYMGWARQTIGSQTQVNGIIVAKSIGDNLRYAASVVPNVSLFEYEVEFHLRSANTIAG
jgi:hypothetical protein